MVAATRSKTQHAICLPPIQAIAKRGRGRPRIHPQRPPSTRGRGRPRIHPPRPPSTRGRGRPRIHPVRLSPAEVYTTQRWSSSSFKRSYTHPCYDTRPYIPCNYSMLDAFKVLFLTTELVDHLHTHTNAKHTGNKEITKQVQPISHPSNILITG